AASPARSELRRSIPTPPGRPSPARKSSAARQSQCAAPGTVGQTPPSAARRWVALRSNLLLPCADARQFLQWHTFENQFVASLADDYKIAIRPVQPAHDVLGDDRVTCGAVLADAAHVWHMADTIVTPVGGGPPRARRAQISVYLLSDARSGCGLHPTRVVLYLSIEFLKERIQQ